MMILEELTTLIPIVPMAIDVAKTYGDIRSDLAARGELIGNIDLWIAAHAKHLGVILVTNNERDFQRLDGVTIENWARS
jgi:tRNA(fMet)-specific endonuclease VapC